MAKKKLFTSDDFEKTPRTQKNAYIKWIVISISIVIAIITIILSLKGCDSEYDALNTVNNITSESKDTLIAEEVIAKGNDSLNVSLTQTEESSSTNHSTDESQILNETKKQVEGLVTNTEEPSYVETEAYKVIRGDYGNNPERKKKLGNNYQPIQNRVNELKRQGVF